MAIVRMGEDNSDRKKTPTLREFVKLSDGKAPKQSNVKVIFPPNNYGGYTFIVDHDFRVQLPKGEKSNTETKEWLNDCLERQATIVVCVVTEPKLVWYLGEDTDSNSDWEVFDWGLKVALAPKRKTQTGKQKQQAGNGGVSGDPMPAA